MLKKEESFLDYFEDIEDPRVGANTRYSASEVLLVALCAIICGADSWRDLVDFGEIKIDFLRQYFPYKYGIPSKNTFYRFFATLKPGSFKECFLSWVSGLKLADNEIIAIDGKTLRHSLITQIIDQQFIW